MRELTTNEDVIIQKLKEKFQLNDEVVREYLEVEKMIKEYGRNHLTRLVKKLAQDEEQARLLAGGK